MYTLKLLLGLGMYAALCVVVLAPLGMKFAGTAVSALLQRKESRS